MSLHPPHAGTRSLVPTAKRKPKPTLNQLPHRRCPHPAEPGWEVLDTALLAGKTRAWHGRSEAGLLRTCQHPKGAQSPGSCHPHPARGSLHPAGRCRIPRGSLVNTTSSAGGTNKHLDLE